jgi:hypothetical protein
MFSPMLCFSRFFSDFVLCYSVLPGLQVPFGAATQGVPLHAATYHSAGLLGESSLEAVSKVPES